MQLWSHWITWWRHQMEKFSALLAICARNSPVPGEFPTQRPVTQRFDVFFDLRLNKRLSKQSRGWWFETLSRSLWRHRNVINVDLIICPFPCVLWFIQALWVKDDPWVQFGVGCLFAWDRLLACTIGSSPRTKKLGHWIYVTLCCKTR